MKGTRAVTYRAEAGRWPTESTQSHLTLMGLTSSVRSGPGRRHSTGGAVTVRARSSRQPSSPNGWVCSHHTITARVAAPRHP